MALARLAVAALPWNSHFADGANSTSVRLRDGTELPVGRTFRGDVLCRLGSGPQW